MCTNFSSIVEVLSIYIRFASMVKEELEELHLFSTLCPLNVKLMLLSELLVAHFSVHNDRASF